MNSVLSCGTSGWFMVAGGVVTYGLLVLAGAVHCVMTSHDHSFFRKQYRLSGKNTRVVLDLKGESQQWREYLLSFTGC